MELRLVDPHILKSNPDNPRLTAPPDSLDADLLASIRAIGLLQPPLVYEDGADLVIDAGHRRVKACIAAEKSEIWTLVTKGKPDPMRAVVENLHRADLGPVDRWRKMESLAAAGWSEAAIAEALNLTQRNIAQMRLLGKICPAMLDHMALNDVPDSRQLRIIANARMEEQAQVWKKHKPKRGSAASWYQIASALDKRRMEATDAKFGDAEAQAFGIVWYQDLFAPADEDGRSTTQVEAFIAAQMAWLEASLKANQRIVEVDEWGRGKLPKGAQHHYGRVTKGVQTGFYIDPRTGAIESIHFTIPVRGDHKADSKGHGATLVPAPRPPVTAKGCAMIGDYRTDALHQALLEHPIEDDQLLAMLVLALGARNVTVQSGVADQRYSNRLRRIAGGLTHGGVLSRDLDDIRTAARAALVEVLSCRENSSASGIGARIVGVAVGADLRLPNMATEAFLPSMSRTALDACAAESRIPARPKLKDTRAAMIVKFQDGTFVYEGARFGLTDAELRAHVELLAELEEDENGDGGGSTSPDDDSGHDDTKEESGAEDPDLE